MKLLRLLPIGKVDAAILEGLYAAIPRRMNVRCEIAAAGLDPGVAYHAERQQYHSSEILGRMQTLADAQSWRVLGIADVDLYIPILKYVFGEAQMGGPCAVVSLFRLRQEFYGLERDDALLSERLLKECIHELGHTLDLRHCQDYRCAMASAHAVEWIDLRESTLCEACRAEVRSRTARLSRLPFARSANSPRP
jgi:archaemetzincin